MVGPGRAALEAEFTGTQIGKFAGIPANGRRVNVLHGAFYELEDGEITSLRMYGLIDGLYRQLVTIPKM
jgi:predicted ester cyclase